MYTCLQRWILLLMSKATDISISPERLSVWFGINSVQWWNDSWFSEVNEIENLNDILRPFYLYVPLIQGVVGWTQLLRGSSRHC